MNLVADGERYMAWQQTFIATIIEHVKANLENAEAPKDVVRNLTEQIAFSVATIIDGSSTVETAEGLELNPILCFLNKEGNLIHCGGNSFMHEYVHNLSRDVFGE